MTKERMEELLNNVINYFAIAENTPAQIAYLANIGFTKEELIYFGYSKEDINSYYFEDDSYYN